MALVAAHGTSKEVDQFDRFDLALRILGGCTS